MKKFLILFSLPFLLFSCTSFDNDSSSQENEMVVEGFVKGSEDIPLLAKLTPMNEDEDLGFDLSSGSISTTNYQSSIDLEKVKKFYLRTLPHMGWKLEENKLERITFVRGNEKVKIGFVNENGDDLVKFFISSNL